MSVLMKTAGVKLIELWLYLCLNKEVHVTFCPYVKTYDCLSLRRDTPSLNAIATVGVSRLFLCFYYRHKVSLADLRSFCFITLGERGASRPQTLSRPPDHESMPLVSYFVLSTPHC